jgi:hypothetical protein
MLRISRSKFRLTSVTLAAGFIATATALAASPAAVPSLAEYISAICSAALNAVGPIRQIVQAGTEAPRRYLVIVTGSPTQLGTPVQVQGE